ncbi:MAG: DEAD/DEAH box helicase [Streptococcaceae bacterium]|jgi:ATP-dependent DNA helicase DinG|nr:DEAD/DEAH box helicase [Streptococcaceae bacterium]
MTRFAIVDLEATDARKSGDKIKIIQVGIVLMENGRRVGQFAADVNPHEKLSRKIRELTGLTDARLAVAPDFATLAAQIRLTLDGAVFVAHNVKFDYGLLSDSLLACGYKLEMPCVDTVELARVFYPSFERYGLDALDVALGLRNKNPHTALSDALATAELLKQIQGKIRALPKAVVREILRHSGQLIAESRLVIEDVFSDCPENVPELELRGGIATLAEAENGPLTESAVPEFSSVLTALGLHVRRDQKKLSALITQDLANNVPSFFEAATGSGKTYAYLLALLAAGRKLVVSTPTKLLQQQLMETVLPRLQEKFGVKSARLIGTQNYISIEKLRAFLKETTDSKNTEIFKMKCLVWLTQTRTGELSELSANMTSRAMLESVAHDGKASEHTLSGELDFWRRAQKNARQADVIVVNHAYLAHRLTDYPETFLENRVLVVDEAQSLLSVLEATQQRALAVLDALVALDFSKNRVKRRLVESLTYQLTQPEISRQKMYQDAQELQMRELTEFLADDSRIYWADKNGLHSSPRDFYNFAKLVPAGTKQIFIGAGLAFSPKNPVLPELLGFPTYNFYQFPQKMQKNQTFLSVADGPDVTKVPAFEYATYAANAISQLSALKRPILVLFTSQEMLDATAESLSELTEIELLAQQPASDAEQLKKSFESKKAQILLATGKFWEGVDFETLNRVLLVIVRLPFSQPTDILARKYAEQFDNGFIEFSVPLATLKLRQAMGRVNRRPTQKSAVILLDSRMAEKPYAKKMRENIAQTVPIVTDTLDEVIKRARDFML